MDKNKIPKGNYCFDTNGQCPYYKEIEHMKIPYTSYYYAPVIECTYLDVNTAQFWINEERNDKILAWLLHDSCKLCGESEE